MDFSASGRCHQPIHQVPRRSSVRSEHSSKLRFFSFSPAGARLFCLGMVALISTLPWNPPSAYAWSFSNDGIPAPPIVVRLDAPSASPPALPSDGPLIAPPKVPPSPSHILISPSLPPISMANPPSPTTGSPIPLPLAKKIKILDWKTIVGATVGAFIFITCSIPLAILFLFYWCKVFRHPLRVFISYGGGSNGHGKNFATSLRERMKSNLKSHIKIFFDQFHGEEGISFATTIMKELAKFDVGIVVVTEEYFERKWSMIELITFVEAQKNDPRNGIRILPLFYKLTPKELKVHLNEGTWEGSWEEMSRGPYPIKVEECREAVTWLCNARGILHLSQRHDFEREYIETICQEIDKIVYKERSSTTNLPWAKTIVKVTQMPSIGTEKRRKRANQRAKKKNNLMTYINKRLQLLFALSGLLNILLSVILDNFFNDLPIRFTAFGILAPFRIICGFLASGCFPWIPLRFIAWIKQYGFLQHVVPCSPWHDNVVIDYCGEVCSLESFKQEEGTRLFEPPMLVQNFLYSNRISLQGNTTIATTHSTFDLKTQDFEVATSVQEGEDFEGLATEIEMFDFAPSNGILQRSHSKMATSQASLPNLQEPPSQVGGIVVDIDHSSLFHILDNEGVPTLEFDGPDINGFPLKVQVFKNRLTKDHTFDLSCIFRSKKTRKMYLTTERLKNLIQNMCQWVENPYPIVVDEASNILHCMTIEDILWEFTKMAYLLRPVHVEHCFLAGLKHIQFLIVLSYILVSSLLSIIPLLSDVKSLFFLFFLFVVVPYVFLLKDSNPTTFYFFKSLFCPVCVKIFGFNRLYKSRSSFRWCNEFRKKKIVNPKEFWIDEEYANTCLDVDSCFVVSKFLELPNIPPKDQSFIVSCQSWPIGNPPILKKQHNYELFVKFDAHEVSNGFECYTGVKLIFLDNTYLLGEKNYSSVEVRRVHLVEKLFHCFFDPSFGGYVEEIYPRGYCSTTFVAHCPRFIDVCNKICSSESIPKLLVASRVRDCKFIVGVPFWSREL